ncbi:hypothetical protein MBANPS3_010637 [Mucor bainieri]
MKSPRSVIYAFFPPTLQPSVSTNKPRVTEVEMKKLNSVFVIKISDNGDLSTPPEVQLEFDANMKDQGNQAEIKKCSHAMAFLAQALAEEPQKMAKWLWTNGYDDSHLPHEATIIEMIRYILTDFAARVFCIHYVDNKLSLLSVGAQSDERWLCISVRSCVIPRTYSMKKDYWLPVMDLLAKLKVLMEDQEMVIQQIQKQQTG